MCKYYKLTRRLDIFLPEYYKHEEGNDFYVYSFIRNRWVKSFYTSIEMLIRWTNNTCYIKEITEKELFLEFI